MRHDLVYHPGVTNALAFVAAEELPASDHKADHLSRAINPFLTLTICTLETTYARPVPLASPR